MKSKVALVRCESYDPVAVEDAVNQAFALLGGAGQFVRPGERILLKPNMLIGDPPEKCVTTHPSVFGAVAKALQMAGAQLSYGDSPAFGSPAGVAKKIGLADVAEVLNIPLADFQEGEEVSFEAGVQNKKFFLAKAISAHDGIVSIPKLKTHGLEKMTGCVKNQFGCIPGLLKGEFHVRLSSPYDFARMLVDLNRLVNPRLYVMDGVWAMEGNGPRGGDPKLMKIILMSADPIALDATVCRLVNVAPGLVPTIQYGYEAGAGTFLEDEIELVGDPLESFRDERFRVDRNPIQRVAKKPILNWMSNRLVPKPVIQADKCIQCGVCVQMCPAKPKALDWFDGNKKVPPQYHYNDCIRCYCCQELCPEKAIILRKPFLRQLFSK